jgi:hypothetical protein
MKNINRLVLAVGLAFLVLAPSLLIIKPAYAATIKNTGSTYTFTDSTCSKIKVKIANNTSTITATDKSHKKYTGLNPNFSQSYVITTNGSCSNSVKGKIEVKNVAGGLGSTADIVISKPGGTSGNTSNGTLTSVGGQPVKNTSSAGDSTDVGCENNSGPFGWLICNIIDAMQSAIDGIFDKIIQPLLVTEPITTSNKTGNQIYKAWSNFRIYGDVFLVIALIIIVFGESLGGGLIDAYTAKKVLPRILVAGVLINISFYLVAILVDVTNIVGNGLMTLITAPFGLTGDFSLDIGFTSGTTMTAFLAGAIIWAKISLAGQFMAWLWFSVLIPLLLIFLSIMVVVLIRRVMIVFLVIISPVAFALYCLPNTEKYFRKWWDTLFETLLVYPIIAVLFALGKVGAYLINHSGGNALTSGVAEILSVVALAAPLVLVPFAFKLAGGIAGRAYDLAKGGRDRMKLGQATRDRIKGQGARNRLQARQKLYSEGQNGKGGKFRRATVGRALRATNKLGLLGYNVEAEASAARGEVAKTLNDQIATGKDDEIRGLTVNKNWALRQNQSTLQADGTWSDGQWRNNGGKRQFKTLGGAWVDEADVDRGHARWGRDTFAQQAALSYEMRKAQDEGQLQSLAKNYKNVAQGDGGWGQDDQQAQGTWIGAAFERQNEHLEFKGTDWETGELNVNKKTGLAGESFVDEVYEKKGSYGMAQMGSNTIEQLKKAHDTASAVLTSATASPDARIKAQEQMDKIKAISETFMHEAGTVVPGSTPGGAPAAILPGTSPGGSRRANTPGAASVAERVYELANLTGAYVAPPSNPNKPGSPQS